MRPSIRGGIVVAVDVVGADDVKYHVGAAAAGDLLATRATKSSGWFGDAAMAPSLTQAAGVFGGAAGSGDHTSRRPRWQARLGCSADAGRAAVDEDPVSPALSHGPPRGLAEDRRESCLRDRRGLDEGEAAAGTGSAFGLVDNAILRACRRRRPRTR